MSNANKLLPARLLPKKRDLEQLEDQMAELADETFVIDELT